MDGLVNLPRILDTIKQLDDFDVICLQEVAINFPGLPGNHGEDQIAMLSAGLPGYTAIFGAATDVPDDQGNRSLFGNAIFSRLPVGQIWRHMLPWAAEPATPSMQRIMVEAVVTAAFGPVRVMTTHLEYYSQHQRKKQIEAIRHLHAEACAMSNHSPQINKLGGPFGSFPRPAEAILCGDMNFPVTANERSQILAKFSGGIPPFLDARKVLHPDQPHIPTVGIHPVSFVDQPECFDYIFITEGLKKNLKGYQTDSATLASDHQPVWITLSK